MLAVSSKYIVWYDIASETEEKEKNQVNVH